MELFPPNKTSFHLPQAEINYFPNFLIKPEADKLFKILLSQTPWQNDEITVFGKTYPQPRLTAYYSTINTSYSYSNITMGSKPFPDYLEKIRLKIEQATNETFNAVLLNLYRNGQDCNGWHADNEKSLGVNPVIASLSLGAERTFNFKHRKIKDEKHKINLHHSSLLIMKGEMQHHWLHQIPKTKKQKEARINLTFRYINEKTEIPQSRFS
ncbi:MAG: alpha-ketoglutarate-dependent dioxygenase AlkB [Bacteroidetes bacterium MedPE-SWsnd-G2]|nr:MAG: alpha-ketoglutarate-dependent dioxygenase AlkB [Bacteroidetes bacterium MedPE-SWsnd-G2]